MLWLCQVPRRQSGLLNGEYHGVRRLPVGSTATQGALALNLQQLIEQTVKGLGYDLVDIERSAGGLLRITLDHPWKPGQTPAFVSVEDCERVTRQLQYVLEVEAVDYRRLEVSSPGIDRPLRHAADFERFAGELIDITLREPIGAAGADGMANAGRKKFRGTLQVASEAARAAGDEWQIELAPDAGSTQPKPGKAKPKPAAAPAALSFKLGDLRDARLAPVVNFKGRAATAQPAA
jgi:ribosome maturation factor RimP